MASNNVFSSFTNTVREIIRESNRDIAALIIEDNIESVWDSNDNWNCETYYKLVIRIPVKIFSKLKSKGILEEYENEIYSCYIDAMRGSSESAKLQNVLLQPYSSVSYGFDAVNDASMWLNGYFRLFISHLTDDKESATNLKTCLKKYGVDCFVAHVDIKVSRKWETEIENALFTMDALCAIITDKFIESNWCDQEVGFAMGQKKVVIPISKGKMPYGFLGKYQALKSENVKKSSEVAKRLWNIITDNPKTKLIYFEKFIALIVTSATIEEAKTKIDILESYDHLDRQLVEMLRNQYKETPVLKDEEILKRANQLFEKYSLDKISFNSAHANIIDNDLPF